jgi:hypothetical protein
MMLEIRNHNLKDCPLCKRPPVVVEIYDFLAVCSCRDPWWGWTMEKLEEAWKVRLADIKKYKYKEMIGGPG